MTLASIGIKTDDSTEHVALGTNFYAAQASRSAGHELRHREKAVATSTAYPLLSPPKKSGISMSVDGRGRALDEVFIERLRRA